MEGEMLGAEFIPSIGIGAKLVADHTQPAFLVRREIVLLEQPSLETRPQFGGFLFRDFGENHVAVFVQCHPFPRGGVDMVVNIQSQQTAGFVFLFFRSLQH